MNCWEGKTPTSALGFFFMADEPFKFLVNNWKLAVHSGLIMILNKSHVIVNMIHLKTQCN